MNLNTQIFPTGGWYFIDRDGLRHEADDLLTLVGNLAMYRERVGQEVTGDEYEEVTNQIGTRCPHMKV